jgi:hypothetical protein
MAHLTPHDPIGDAKAELEVLEMHDNQHISKYLVKFNKLSTLIEWNPPALHRRFYKGLPTRIKNEIAQVGKPNTLQGLCTLAQSIDTHYWEYKMEQNQESSSTLKSTHQDKKTPNSNFSQQQSHKQSNPSSSKPHNSTSSSSNLPKPPPAKSSSAPSLSNKLGKDSKLTQEEQQHHFNNKLCLFCSGPGHTAKDCKKPNSQAAKACAASTKSKDKSQSSNTKKS